MLQAEALMSDHLAEGLPTWDPEHDDVLICRQVRQETHDVKTFVLEPRTASLFRFKPGQFLTFDFEIGGERINRSYTISSSPTRPHLVAITVKRVPGGPVSNWLHDQMRPGMQLRAVGPLGEFTSLDRPAAKYLFLSGGSGITPLMSMARSYHDLALDRDIVFVHNARTPADIIFRHELELIARNLPGFCFVPVCDSEGASERWGGYRGRISRPMLEMIAPDLLEREVFACGPAPYMAAVRAILAEIGFDVARYHEESFDYTTLVGESEETVRQAAAAETPTFRVEFTKSRRVVECDAGTTVLNAARAAGMRLPSSCAKGLCGTCKSRLVSGKVEMKHAGGIRQREIDQGWVLLCCAKPQGDLVVER
ncbi:2Fe-2S iron-sulfur cluster-binding protein [Benzoatithermus flavus]|uniref:Hybrid-cluster NAD(P)-dependent oxidoreductase n=1 Tax=Benzoatithermus flavus TaxID=3108223 RepID=A0ABU8XP68_9PROT